MSGATLWFAILGMAAVTYLVRVAFLLLHKRIKMPPLLRRAMRYVPFAVFGALIAPEVLLGDPVEGFTFERLLAALAGAFVAWRSGSVLLTLFVGMGLLWLLQLL